MADIVLTSNTGIESFTTSVLLTGAIELFSSVTNISTTVFLTNIDVNHVEYLNSISESTIITSSDISIKYSLIADIPNNIILTTATLTYIEHLSSESKNNSEISGSLTIGDEEILIKLTEIFTAVSGGLILEVRCVNCKFNNSRSSTKNGPKCFRTVRFSNEETKTICGMYMFKKV